MCGSGQQAINFAASMVMSGQHDVLIGGGVEHMTRVPMGSDGDSLTDTYFEHFDELTTQGEGAERIAEEYGFSREELDEIAVDSQRRWGEAWEAGHYDDQLVPVETEVDGDPVTVEQDEHPRPETDLETLSGLPLSFRKEGNGRHHAGNSSGIVDGSSAVLVCSEEAAEEHGWDPLARIVATEVVGVDPITMLTGPIPATEQVLEKADMEIEEIDYFEVNEAFAAVVAAWLEETGASWEDVNVDGGAIAHGHPLGATGSALMTKLTHQLQRENADYGLCTMCIGFGQGIATIIERV
jgi:acetyl-CoA C-acetyltransferase